MHRHYKLKHYFPVNNPTYVKGLHDLLGRCYGNIRQCVWPMHTTIASHQRLSSNASSCLGQETISEINTSRSKFRLNNRTMTLYVCVLVCMYVCTETMEETAVWLFVIKYLQLNSLERCWNRNFKAPCIYFYLNRCRLLCPAPKIAAAPGFGRLSIWAARSFGNCGTIQGQVPQYDLPNVNFKLWSVVHNAGFDWSFWRQKVK